MAITFDNKAERAQTAALMGFSFTTSSGADLLVVGAGIRSSTANVSQVTFNGSNLTFSCATISAGVYASMWYLQNPFIGTSTVFVTQSGTGSQQAIASSWMGTDTTAGIFDGEAGDSTGNANTSIAITTSQDGSLIVDYVFNESNSNSSIASGQTLLFSTDQGTWATAGSYIIKATAGTQNMNWTNASADFTAHVGTAFKVAAAGGGGAGPVVGAYMTTNTAFWGP